MERKEKGLRRGTVLLVVFGLVIAFGLAGPLRGFALEGTETPDTSKTASPESSPGASPVALAGDVEAGKKLAVQCLGCHTIDGNTSVGPTWKGLYGTEVELEDGSKVIADEAFLTESIKDPNAKIAKGFPAGAMPPYGAILSDQNVADLVAYIKSLSDEEEVDDED